MKSILFSFCLLITFYTVSAQGAPEGLFISSKAPDFRAKDQYGTEIRLKELLKKGKVVADGEKAKILTSENLSRLFEIPIQLVAVNGFYQAVPGTP